jgi:GNAT superfamily N-acetyltransferase
MFEYSAHAAAGVTDRQAMPKAASAGARPMVGVRKLGSHDVQWLPALCDLLIDAVHRGATLGFLAPLSRHVAMNYWLDTLARLGPQRSLWIACASDDEGHCGPLQGAVQLAPAASANAYHRGEVQRLMVHSQSRGRGIASQLMQRAECAALAQRRSMLVLEVPSGSQAEGVFVHLGWQCAGELPDYDTNADGQMHGASFYFKRLQPAR